MTIELYRGGDHPRLHCTVCKSDEYLTETAITFAAGLSLIDAFKAQHEHGRKK